MKVVERKPTGKLTTSGSMIYEGDYIESKTISKYLLCITGQVKWDEVNQKWLNLNIFDDDTLHTIKHITEKKYQTKLLKK